MRDRLRMDMTQDPPPDLAIEADVTSQTTLEAYAVLQVPEVWIYDNGKLKIHLLQNDEYQESTISPTFADLAIAEVIPQLVQQAFQQGTSTMLRNLRNQMAEKA